MPVDTQECALHQLWPSRSHLCCCSVLSLLESPGSQGDLKKQPESKVGEICRGKMEPPGVQRSSEQQQPRLEHSWIHLPIVSDQE